MKYAVPLILVASPALAHHETVVISMMPALTIWAMAAAAAGLSLWKRWRRK